jgi:hypothetical protein
MSISIFSKAFVEISAAAHQSLMVDRLMDRLTSSRDIASNSPLSSSNLTKGNRTL